MTTQRKGTLPDAAVEDYLKTIYQHTEWQDKAITPSALASRLGVTPASVTGMVKKLTAQGLIDHVPYGPLYLTHRGTLRAIAVVRRHRLIETWLVQYFGYAWDEVHDEAELLEHSVSDRLLAVMDQRLGHPSTDPHGDPIPDATGFTRPTGFSLLAELGSDQQAVLLRVDDKIPELLRLLAAHQIIPGRTLTIQAHHGKHLYISVPGSEENQTVRLNASDAKRIWVRPIREGS